MPTNATKPAKARRSKVSLLDALEKLRVAVDVVRRAAKPASVQDKVAAHLAAKYVGEDAYSLKDRLLFQMRSQMKTAKLQTIDMASGNKYLIVDKFREARKEAKDKPNRPMPAVGKYVMISQFELKEVK